MVRLMTFLFLNSAAVFKTLSIQAQNIKITLSDVRFLGNEDEVQVFEAKFKVQSGQLVVPVFHSIDLPWPKAKAYSFVLDPSVINLYLLG